MDVYTDEDLEDLLKKNIRLTRENNKLLRKLWHASVFGFWSKVLFTAILIGVPFLLYQYVLVNYVNQARSTYQGFVEKLNQFKELPSSASVSSVIETMRHSSE